MKLTIFAATGGTGRALLDQALAAGHEVTAVVRNPRDLPGRARVVRADMLDVRASALESAVEGADAVLSCIGPRSKAEAVARTCATGTRSVIEAMKATDAGASSWSVPNP